MRLSKIIALTVMVAVAAAFITPAVHLEPTALRSARIAVALFAALSSLLLLGFEDSRHPLALVDPQTREIFSPSESVLSLICSRLC